MSYNRVYQYHPKINKMKNLQSKDMPLRTIDQFYCPIIKQKSHEGIRVFRSKLALKDDILLPKGEAGSILEYVSSLNSARQLPRKVYDRQYFYPEVSRCRRHDFRHKISQTMDMPEQENYSKPHRRDTLSIPTNTSTVDYSKGKIRLQKLKLKDLKDQSQSLQHESQSKQMRFSFYNTIEKSNYFNKKYRQDHYLDQRRTNNFQNMFNRTITTDNLLDLLQSSRKRLKVGVL